MIFSALPALPIDPLKPSVLDALQPTGRLVVTAPTGSGKSTRIPLWCVEAGWRVLVVEPRRVACRALARYVALATGSSVGRRVGYAVRHEHHYSEGSRVVYATPGTVLRMMQAETGGEGAKTFLRSWEVLMLDEFHERHIETDLLLAYARHLDIPRVVVMSATIESKPLSDYLHAEVLEGHGRMFPVTVEYAGQPIVPSARGLDRRIAEAVEQILDRPGDVLVFLPGKAEISACGSALRRLSRAHGFEVMPLHGDLPPAQQDRPFEESRVRRVILATNVAETSITLPNIGIVVDSGLVRQTRYHWGSGVLGLVAISRDSAEQRRGRAGRLAPGHCLRLWGEVAKLDETSPPEILREELTDAVLMSASCGISMTDLILLDPPRPYAVQAGVDALQRLGCLDSGGEVTPIGREVAHLPVRARHGRFLVEAARAVRVGAHGSLLHDAIDLVASLSAGRRLFLRADGPLSLQRQEWVRTQCDATAHIAALRVGRAERDALNPWVLQQGRRVAKQLRAILVRLAQIEGYSPSRVSPTDSPPPRVHPSSSDRPDGFASLDRPALVRTWILADPQSVYARRKGREAFSNEREEVRLANESIASPQSEAIIVVESHSLRQRSRRVVRLATCVIPTNLAAIAAVVSGPAPLAGISATEGEETTIEVVTSQNVEWGGIDLAGGQLSQMGSSDSIENVKKDAAPNTQVAPGTVELADVEVLEGRLVARMRRTYAGHTLQSWDEEPQGEWARRALVHALRWGLVFADIMAETRERIARWNLYRRLKRLKGQPAVVFGRWLEQRVESLGVQSGEDLALLIPADLRFEWPDEMDETEREWLRREFPPALNLGDASYEIRYDVTKRVVTLVHESGNIRFTPQVRYLPPWSGWRIQVQRGNAISVLRL